MSRRIHKQFFYRIPKTHAEQFVCFVSMNDGNGTYFEIGSVFDAGECYEYFINECGIGTYPFLETQLKNFAIECGHQ